MNSRKSVPNQQQRTLSIASEDHAQRRQTVAEIMKQEDARYKKLQSEPKLLIVGGSDSGKSTLVKQLRILHGDQIKPTEVALYREAIRKKILMASHTIIDDFEELKEVRKD